jgi:glycosyltransferase involved in cell wall biosynthesis
MKKGKIRIVRVLIVDTTKVPCGSFEASLTLARHLNGKPGIRAGLITAQPRKVIRNRVPKELTCVRLDHPPAEEISSYPRAKIAVSTELRRRGNLLAAVRLAFIAKLFACDILHLNNLLTRQLHGVIAARLGGFKCLCSHRGIEWSSKLAARLESDINRHVACSTLIESDLVTKGIRKDKIVTLPNCVDIDVFSPQVAAVDVTRSFGIPAGRKLIAVFARLVPWKGHDIFLIAAKKILEGFPEAHILVVGGAGEEEPGYEGRLKVMSSAYGLTGRITFAGHRRDIPAIMRACSAIVHASTKPEPFGLAVLEAMASGVPVIAAAEGGPMDMIRDGIDGHLCPPGDAHFLEEKIASVLADPESAAKIASAGRERAVQLFAADKVALQHALVYRSLPGIRA